MENIIKVKKETHASISVELDSMYVKVELINVRTENTLVGLRERLVNHHIMEDDLKLDDVTSFIFREVANHLDLVSDFDTFGHPDQLVKVCVEADGIDFNDSFLIVGQISEEIVEHPIDDPANQKHGITNHDLDEIQKGKDSVAHLVHSDWGYDPKDATHLVASRSIGDELLHKNTRDGGYATC